MGKLRCLIDIPPGEVKRITDDAPGHPMAVNLFTKTWLAHHQTTPALQKAPSFVICENDDRRTEAFMEDIRQKGGSELAGRISRSSNGRE